MPNKNYVSGRNFEYNTMRKYENNGYPYTFRMAGSHTIFDVIAVKKGEIVFIQCKKGYLSPKQKEDVIFGMMKFLKEIGAKTTVKIRLEHKEDK